jgi:hypothetical protein
VIWGTVRRFFGGATQPFAASLPVTLLTFLQEEPPALNNPTVRAHSDHSPFLNSLPLFINVKPFQSTWQTLLSSWSHIIIPGALTFPTSSLLHFHKLKNSRQQRFHCTRFVARDCKISIEFLRSSSSRTDNFFKTLFRCSSLSLWWGNSLRAAFSNIELKENTIIVVLGASGDLAKKKTVRAQWPLKSSSANLSISVPSPFWSRE